MWIKVAFLQKLLNLVWTDIKQFKIYQRLIKITELLESLKGLRIILYHCGVSHALIESAAHYCKREANC